MVKSIIPSNIHGCIVMQGYLDPQLRDAIAPKHLLDGISKCLLEVYFLEFKSINKCSRLDACSSSEMEEAGLSSRKAPFNYKIDFKNLFFV